MSPNKPPPHNYAYRLPADLKNVVSQTTLRVLEGGNTSNTNVTQEDTSRELRSSEMSEAAKLYQRIIRRPTIKKDAQENDAQQRYEKPTLDISLTHVSIFAFLN